MLDIFTTSIVIIVLVPLFYLGSPDNFSNVFSLILLILISIPTIMAMVNGAPFVPTPMKRVKEMVKLAKLKQGDRVYDIGCGDGRFVYVAANQYGANATGYELSPLVYVLARIMKLIWKSKAEISFANFKMQDLSDADVIFCYLLPESLKKFEKKLTKMTKPGTKLISYAFEMPNWNLVQRIERNPKQNLAPIWIYERSA